MNADTATYSPGMIDHILRNWELYLALAESPGTSRQHLEPEHPGPTPNTPRLTPKHSFRADSMGGACVVADVEKARAEALVGLSLEWYVVEALMHRGWSLSRYARESNIGKQRTCEAYGAACVKMACYLGWVETMVQTET